jgi:hypothetical protein
VILIEQLVSMIHAIYTFDDVSFAINTCLALLTESNASTYFYYEWRSL